MPRTICACCKIKRLVTVLLSSSPAPVDLDQCDRQNGEECRQTYHQRVPDLLTERCFTSKEGRLIVILMKPAQSQTSHFRICTGFSYVPGQQQGRRATLCCQVACISELSDLPDSSCSDRPGDRSKMIEDHPAMGSKSIRQRRSCRRCDLPEQIGLVYRHDAPHPVRRLESETGIVLVCVRLSIKAVGTCSYVQMSHVQMPHVYYVHVQIVAKSESRSTACHAMHSCLLTVMALLSAETLERMLWRNASGVEASQCWQTSLCTCCCDRCR